jgi:hypothetical protein
MAEQDTLLNKRHVLSRPCSMCSLLPLAYSRLKHIHNTVRMNVRILNQRSSRITFGYPWYIVEQYDALTSLCCAVGCLSARPIWQENTDTIRIANRLIIVHEI